MTEHKTGRVSGIEQARIAALAEAGLTAIQIAVELGRSASTVANYLWRNGITANRANARWRDADDADLIAGIRLGLTEQALGDQLGRTADAIHSRIAYLGGRHLLLYPASATRDLPLPEVPTGPITRQSDPYHLWTQANARVAARGGRHA